METRNCDYCERELPVFDPSKMKETHYRLMGTPEAELYVRLTVDPFESEIRHNDELQWLCQGCYDGAYMNI